MIRRDAQFDADTLRLAMQIEQSLPPEQDASELFAACCWILADLLLAAERRNQQDILESTVLLLDNVLRCAEILRTSPLPPRYGVTH